MNDTPQGLDAVRALKPRAVILDKGMPFGIGIDVLGDIERESLALIVIGLIHYL